MTARRSTALAGVCAMLALAAGLWLIGLHWQAAAFSTRLNVPAQWKRRAAVAADPFPHGTVNVNTADLQTLDTLAGVGPVTAQAIVDEREQNGPFDFPQDLLLVKGIGEKTLARFFNQLDFSAEEATRQQGR